jgi:hypothetical protein
MTPLQMTWTPRCADEISGHSWWGVWVTTLDNFKRDKALSFFNMATSGMVWVTPGKCGWPLGGSGWPYWGVWCRVFKGVKRRPQVAYPAVGHPWKGCKALSGVASSRAWIDIFSKGSRKCNPCLWGQTIMLQFTQIKQSLNNMTFFFKGCRGVAIL